MKALITGASSGIGKEFAKQLSKMGYDVILVARRTERLEELRKKLKTNSQIIKADLSNENEVKELYEKTKNENIDILINNAGFGALGNFEEIELEREIEMINTNVKAVHILTKLFLKDFIKKDKGYILNVASIAGFFSGPYLATYYATKSYVLTLTESIYGELKNKKSNVYVGALCPGPVKTEFDQVANVKFSLKGVTAPYVAKYAIEKMFKGKNIILPSFSVKSAVFFSRFVPRKMLLKIVSKSQIKKM